MKSKIKILGIGHSVPKMVYTNEYIEQITDNSNAEWIYNKLGIQQRYISTDEDVVSLGTASALEALEDANFDVNDLNLIIVNTSSADKLSPSVACMIQNNINANCPAFDINAVCSGFIYGLDLIGELLSKYNNILLVSTETYSKITDWDDKNSCYFGDGSAALILTNGSFNNFTCNIGADGSGWENFKCDRNSTYQMDGKEVYNFGINVLPIEINKLLKNIKLDISDIDYIIPHQPSHNILKETAKIVGIEKSKVCFNMLNYANTAGASIPMALYKLIKNNSIKNEDNLILASIGSGWTYGVGYLKLEYK